MKKLFSLALICMLTFSATVLPDKEVSAQTSFVSQYSNVLDTITNTTAKYLTLATQPTSTNNILEIQFTATKISGTVGGTVVVQTSLDGTDWYTAVGTASYTLTDATQTTVFKITDWGAKYIRILATPTGTMSAQIKAKYVARKLTVAQVRL